MTESKKLFAILRSMCNLNSECYRREIIDSLPWTDILFFCAIARKLVSASRIG